MPTLDGVLVNNNKELLKSVWALHFLSRDHVTTIVI
jgi:hypothetical protein